MFFPYAGCPRLMNQEEGRNFECYVLYEADAGGSGVSARAVPCRHPMKTKNVAHAHASDLTTHSSS